MNAQWQDLLVNFAIVALFVSVWTQMTGRLEAWPGYLRSISYGCLMGAGTIVLMSLPVEMGPGRFVDLRFSLLALSGFFGGPLAGLVTASITGAARLYVGGGGVLPGMVGILAAAIVGVASSAFMRGRTTTRWHLVLFSAATALSFLSSFLFSLNPANVVHYGLPTATMLFVSTLVVSFTIHQDNSRRQVSRENFTYRAIIESLPDSLNAKDRDGRFIAANPATADIMHAGSAVDLIGRTDYDFYPRETADIFRQDELNVLDAQVTRLLEQKIVRRDGTTVWLSTQKTPLRNRAGELVGLITHNRDITDRKRLELELAESQARLSIALTQMSVALVMFDRNGRLIYSNEQYGALFADMAEVRSPNANLRDILRASAERGEQTGIPVDKIEQWLESIRSGKQIDTDREVLMADGRWMQIRIRSTLDCGILAVVSEISARKLAEQKLAELNIQLELLAMTDGLTGLMNRRAFDKALNDEIARSRRSRQPLSLLMIDVDKFKSFNDTYGHLAGDTCLRSIAASLKHNLRSTDMIARYGGEELAIVLPDTTVAGALHLAETLRLGVRRMAVAHSRNAGRIVTVSIGVCGFEPDDELAAAEDVIMRADAALYAAKAAGRDRVHGPPLEQLIKSLNAPRLLAVR